MWGKIIHFWDGILFHLIQALNILVLVDTQSECTPCLGYIKMYFIFISALIQVVYAASDWFVEVSVIIYQG